MSERIGGPALVPTPSPTGRHMREAPTMKYLDKSSIRRDMHRRARVTKRTNHPRYGMPNTPKSAQEKLSGSSCFVTERLVLRRVGL